MKPKAKARSEKPSRDSETADPIFAAILAHEKAYHEFSAAVAEENYLESTIGGPDKTTAPDGKARWREFRKRYDAASDAEQRTAWALTTTVPTTWDGLQSLMRYAGVYVLQFGMAPPDRVSGVPAAVGRLHEDLHKYGYIADEPWWTALVLTCQMALQRLRDTKADTCEPPSAKVLREIAAEWLHGIGQCAQM